MTYYPEKASVIANMNLYHTAGSSAVVGNYVSWSAQETTGFDFPLSQSGAAFTLPDDGNVYVLEASLAPGGTSTSQLGVSFGWELDASGVIVGNKAIGTVLLNNAEYTLGFWGDERARCVVVPSGSAVVARLMITDVHGSPVSTLDGSRFAQDAKARAVVWQLLS